MNRIYLISMAMFALAAVLLVATLVIAWSGYQRIAGVAAIRAARTTLENGVDLTHGRHLAADVALPREPAAVLLSLDFADAGSDAVLDRLGQVCKPEDRPVVDTARQFGHVLRHEPAVLDKPDDPDQALLAAVIAMRAGTVGGTLPSTTSPPQLPVLELFYLEQLQASLAARDLGTASADAGALALLMPNHPDSGLAQVLAVALSPSFDEVRLGTLVLRTGGQANALGLLLDLAQLEPERELPLIRAGLRLPPNATATSVLQGLVQAARSGSTDVQRCVQICLDSHQADLATPLIPLLPQALQDAYGRAIRISSGDMGMLAALGAHDPLLLPHCSTPQVRHGILCFHLSNALGSLPLGGVVIKLNGTAVSERSMHRIGTLFGIKPGVHGQVLVQVLAGALTVFDETVPL